MNSGSENLATKKMGIVDAQTSLRLSCDNDESDRLSYSTDGTEIDFIFEQEPYDEVSSFSLQNRQQGQQKKSMRKKIFEKYHKVLGHKPTEQSANDILIEFDKIFEFKKSDEAAHKPGKQSIISRIFHKKKNIDDPEIYQASQNQLKQQNENCSSLENISAIQIDENKQAENHPTNKQGQHSSEFITCQTIQQADQIVKQQPQITKGLEESQSLITPLYQEQERIPIFLRRVRYLNSIYPNFQSLTADITEQIIKLEQICSELAKSHAILKQISIYTLDFINKPKYMNRSMANLNYFLNSGWENHEPIPYVDLIRPHTNIPVSKIKPNMIIQALKNYEQVIDYYKNSISNKKILQQTKQRQIQWYINIRKKFWAIEKNIRSISEDVYMLSLEREHPNYVYWYLHVLRSQLPRKGEKRTFEQHRRILGIVLQNRQRGELLSVSEVGLAVKNKLQRQLKYLYPF